MPNEKKISLLRVHSANILTECQMMQKIDVKETENTTRSIGRFLVDKSQNLRNSVSRI